jgi:muramidase (phage lysozyme)
MATGADNKQPATFDGATGELLPTPQDIKLKTADDVRLEMARVYRDMRQGRIETADGTKLTYVLTGLLKAIETGVIEQRMNALENTLKARLS